MPKQTIKQAMIDGVMSAVREETAAAFKVYRHGTLEAGQQERTSNGLIQISLAAIGMLGLIDVLASSRPDA
jgi:hypothetical protein